MADNSGQKTSDRYISMQFLDEAGGRSGMESLTNPVEALVVVDVQYAFVMGDEAVPGHKILTSMIGVLLKRARSAEAPVIFLQQDGPVGAADEPFTPGWALFFPPLPHEKVIRKTSDNGFDGTSLHALLTDKGIRTVAICGLLSEMCVAATARAAIECGYGVLLPHDAHATYDVPPGPGSEGVPAAMAARAAEWSLGDGVRICASAAEVSFVPRHETNPTLSINASCP